jgi:hypothetical protein
MQKYKIIDHPKVTRVEVIDGQGRAYFNWHENNQVQTQLQDDGRTLKIFITRNVVVGEKIIRRKK